jgi:hypothetical protein
MQRWHLGGFKDEGLKWLKWMEDFWDGSNPISYQIWGWVKTY